MITKAQYVGPHASSPDWTPLRQSNSDTLLDKVNRLMGEAAADGVKFPTNPSTKSLLSGKAFGGFRPQSCPQGAPDSSHKEGSGADIYDPLNAFDKWLDKFESADGHNSKLAEHGLHREHPSKTDKWCHLTTRAPKSKRRTFYP